LEKPTEMNITLSFKELAESSDVFFTGPFTAESILIHRVVFNEN